MSEEAGGVWSLESRQMVYDVLLISSFVGMVLLPLLINLFTKVLRVQQLMRRSLESACLLTDRFEKATAKLMWLVEKLTEYGLMDDFVWVDEQPSGQEWAGVAVRLAYARFRVGLASAKDKQTLKNYLAGPAGAGLLALPIERLREVLMEHYKNDKALSEQELGTYLDIVAEQSRQELIDLCWSEGLSAPTETFKPMGQQPQPTWHEDTEQFANPLGPATNGTSAQSQSLHDLPEPRTVPETPRVGREVFQQVDTDGSGEISFSEFSTWWSERQLATQGALDESTLAEIQRVWADADSNGDGSLSAEEFDLVVDKVSASEWQPTVDPSSGRQ